MPNWVTNRVVAEDFDKLQEALINKETGEVDFNILKSMHDDLNITAGCGEYLTPLDYNPNKEVLKFQREKLNEFLQDRYNNTITQEQFVDRTLIHLVGTKLEQEIKEVYDIDKLGQQTREAIVNILKGYFNVQRYGYNNWYNAQRNEWGTKWNAHDTCVCGAEISFNTAWSTPMGIWEALSKITPITVAFADEDTGSNCGIIKFEDGHAVSEFGRSDEAKNLNKDEQYLVDVGFALAIAGSNVEDFIDMYGDEEIEESFNTDKIRAEAIMKKSYAETKAVLVSNGFEM